MLETNSMSTPAVEGKKDSIFPFKSSITHPVKHTGFMM